MIPKDSHVLQPAEVRRLTGQNARVYARLNVGPATRRELAHYALNVTGRISDIRAYLKPQGQTVTVDEQPNGLSVYRIVDLPKSESDVHNLNQWELR